MRILSYQRQGWAIALLLHCLRGYEVQGGDCHYKKGGVLHERLRLQKNSALERLVSCTLLITVCQETVNVHELFLLSVSSFTFWECVMNVSNG